MDSRTQNLIQTGIEAKNYRDFLSHVFAASAKNGKFNYSAFSRKAGFTSRSFIKEVVDGRRRLTGASFPKVLKALSLPLNLRHYFTYLVSLEEDELNLERQTPEQIQTKLKEIRAKLKSQLETVNQAKPETIYKGHQVLEVYSVLGGQEHGIDLKEIQRRSGFDDTTCENILEYLLAQKLIVKEKTHYRSINSHLVYEGLGGDQGFRSAYLETVDVLKRKAANRFKSDDQLFYQSYFSVDKHRMPELKKRLREVIHEFVETSGNDNGDAVAKLIVGFFT